MPHVKQYVIATWPLTCADICLLFNSICFLILLVNTLVIYNKLINSVSMNTYFAQKTQMN